MRFGVLKEKMLLNPPHTLLCAFLHQPFTGVAIPFSLESMLKKLSRVGT